MLLFFGTLFFVTWMAGPWIGIAAAVGVTAGWHWLVWWSAREVENAEVGAVMADYRAKMGNLRGGENEP